MKMVILHDSTVFRRDTFRLLQSCISGLKLSVLGLSNVCYCCFKFAKTSFSGNGVVAQIYLTLTLTVTQPAHTLTLLSAY